MINEIPVSPKSLNEDGVDAKTSSDGIVSDLPDFGTLLDNITDKLHPEQPQLRLPTPYAPILTPEQQANMNPDARQKYDAMKEQRLQAMGFASIAREEEKAVWGQKFPEIQIPGHMRAGMASYIWETLREVFRVGETISHWFQATQDEDRLRAFIRAVGFEHQQLF